MNTSELYLILMTYFGYCQVTTSSSNIENDKGTEFSNSMNSNNRFVIGQFSSKSEGNTQFSL